MNKIWVKILVIILVFAAGFIAGREIVLAPADGNEPAAVADSAMITASLKIDGGTGEMRFFDEISLDQNATVFDLLKAAVSVESNNFRFDYKDYGGDMGAFITAINGLANDPAGAKYWQFWVNGEYSKVGASVYKLKDGDSVEWKYLKGQF